MKTTKVGTISKMKHTGTISKMNKKEIALSLSPDNTIDENKDIFQRWLAKTYHSKIVEDTKKRLHVTIF